MGYSIPAMGKLAERYEDAARSGVYRVSALEVPIRAASEAHSPAFEVDPEGIRELAAKLQLRMAQADRRPCVVLVNEGAALARQQDGRYTLLLRDLRILADQCRDSGLPFFAVLVDPEETLDLPRLYKEA